jgi:hypothetical protein
MPPEQLAFFHEHARLLGCLNEALARHLCLLSSLKGRETGLHRWIKGKRIRGTVLEGAATPALEPSSVLRIMVFNR